MEQAQNLQVEIVSDEALKQRDYDFERLIYDVDTQLDLLSSHADKLDYLVAVGSGLLCGMLDIFWDGEFSLERGRELAQDKVEHIVVRAAGLLGCKTDDLTSSVRFLEQKFPIPSDGNTPDFGGGLNHHLRDFAHHPTFVGLMFSLLTQFTLHSYGTDVNGAFLVVPVREASKAFIGKDVSTKLLYGTLTWFFHLISDMAGSSATAGLSGGTGIPGPILSLAKEMSALPLFKSLNESENSISVFLSKLFNGTLFAKRDAAGKIIKDSVVRFDLRGEMGLGAEVMRQALPVLANECIVRLFYSIRRFAAELKAKNVRTISELERLDARAFLPGENPTMTRMLTISSGVFTAVDLGEAIVTKKYWVAVNYAGVGRFAVALGKDISWGLRRRNMMAIKAMYETMKRSTYREADNTTYGRMGRDVNVDRFELTREQVEILYNIECQLVRNDVLTTKLPVNNDAVRSLKWEWLDEWKNYITQGFSSFLNIPDAVIEWYDMDELRRKIEENNPSDVWFRLVLLEAMLFEPYYSMTLEDDGKGGQRPSTKYKSLRYSSKGADGYLNAQFAGYYQSDYVKRLRRCYSNVLRNLNEIQKSVAISLLITAGTMIVTVATAGVLAPYCAVALVGSNFAGLSGSALTSACLAYLGGGAIAAGGLGMAGGTAVVVGGGAALGFAAGAGVGATVGAAGLMSKRNTILQSAKLLVAVREIFLNDEHDLEYSNSIYEQYVENISEIEKKQADMRVRAADLTGDEKKKALEEIEALEKSAKAMKIARSSLKSFISAYKVGMSKA